MPNKTKTMPPYHAKRKTYLTRACRTADSLHQPQPCLLCLHTRSRLHNVPHYNTGKPFFQHCPTHIMPTYHSFIISFNYDSYIHLKQTEGMPNKTKPMPPYHVKQKTYVAQPCHAANSLHHYNVNLVHRFQNIRQLLQPTLT